MSIANEKSISAIQSRFFCITSSLKYAFPGAPSSGRSYSTYSPARHSGRQLSGRPSSQVSIASTIKATAPIIEAATPLNVSFSTLTARAATTAIAGNAPRHDKERPTSFELLVSSEKELPYIVKYDNVIFIYK
ncbi:hypothetical protein [Bradyrhizobium sp. USDA 4449]